MNAVTVQYARELRDLGVKVNACAPDLTGYPGERSPIQGATVAIRLATAADVPTGAFLDDDGHVPW